MPESAQHKIVILETDPQRRDYLRSLVSGWGFRPFTFQSVSDCLDNLLPVSPSLVISGAFPLEKSCRFINTLKVTNGCLPVVIISDDPAIENFTTINALSDVIVVRPNLEPSEMMAAVSDLLENKNGTQNPQNSVLIVGNSPEMVRIKKMISALNRVNEAVLIQGEIGTGKELLAKAIHSKIHKDQSCFIKINGAELSLHNVDGELIDDLSDLWPGALPDDSESAHAVNTGTLFIYEIGALPAVYQASLLRFFDEGGILKTANGEISLRLIVSSSAALELLVQKGRFRNDLFYRLNVIQFILPPLRERTGDIALLTDFFTEKFCIEFRKSHFNLSDEAKKIFCRYHWPGNVAELQNLIRMAVLCGNQDSIIAKLSAETAFPMPMKRGVRIEDVDYEQDMVDIIKRLRNSKTLALKDICDHFAARVEQKMLKWVLDQTKWNRRKAARMLDISYKSLLTKIKGYELA